VVSALGVGYIYFDKSWDGYIYYATSANDLAVIFQYFDKFPPIVPPKLADLNTLKHLTALKAKGLHSPNHPNHPNHHMFLTLSKQLVNS